MERRAITMERRGRGKNPWKSPFVVGKVGVNTPGGAGIPRDGLGVLNDLPQTSAILEIVQRNLVIRTRLAPDRLGFSPAGLTAKRRASAAGRDKFLDFVATTTSCLGRRSDQQR